MNSGHRSSLRWVAVTVSVLLVGAVACTKSDRAAEGGEGKPDRKAELASKFKFVEVARESGLTPSDFQVGPAGNLGMASGVSVFDVDSDGDSDVFLPRVGRPNLLFLNDGNGNFTEVARAVGIAGPMQRWGSNAAAFADFNGDGSPDLFTAGSGLGPDEYFLGNGDGTFRPAPIERDYVGETTVVSADVDAQADGVHRFGTSVADINGDGHMDLLVFEWYTQVYGGDATEVVRRATSENSKNGSAISPCLAAAEIRKAGYPGKRDSRPTMSGLYLNDGSGAFRDATDEMGLPLDEIVAFTGVVVDVDNDTWPDLAITGDGCTSRLFRNVDGRSFKDVTDTAGVGLDENGMGLAPADLDGNGFADMFVTGIRYSSKDDVCPVQGVFNGCGGNRLYMNSGNLKFEDRTDDYGVRDAGWGWGTQFADFDSDGMELVATNGFDWELDAATSGSPVEVEFFEHFREDPFRFWVMDPESGRYVDIAKELGLDVTSVGHGLVAFDMDGDGDLDLLDVPSDARPQLWRNDSPARGSWISIELSDPGSPGNTWGDGARIEVTPSPGDKPRTFWVTTSGSYQTQLRAPVHVGLGSLSDPVHQVTVHWPYGGEVQTVDDVQLDRTTVIRRGDS